MVAKPTKQPEWASDETQVTEPSAGEKSVGWPAGNPRRQYANWLHVQAWKWSVWFEQALAPFDLLYPNGPLPGGSAPATGAGLAVGAASFSGRAIVNATPVKLTSAQAYMYTASRDTYWDLSDAAIWTPVVVTNGAGEPAVTANSVRFYKVVTDATDRTSVVDRRPSILRQLTRDAIGAIRHVWADTLDTPGQSATAAVRALPHQTFLAGNVGGANYETIQSFEVPASAAALALRDHLSVATDGTDRVQLIRVQGLHRSTTVNEWVADDTTAYLEFLQAGKITTWVVSGLTPASSYSDVALLVLAPVFRHDFGSGIRIAPLENFAADALRAHVEHVRGSGVYTLVRLDASNEVAEYIGASIVGGSAGWARAINAKYNPTSGLWDRTAAGDCFLEAHTKAGRILFLHKSTDGANFANTRAAGTWEVMAEDTSLNRDKVAKAWVLIQTTAGVPSIVASMNVSAVASQTGGVRCTMSSGFASATAYGGFANCSSTADLARLLNIDGTHFDVRLGATVMDDIDILGTSATRTIFACVFGLQP